ncbi:glycosyltransferase [Microbacterium invictum]|uniref:D-inositol 3-phosphate glycosyltransferase n=1 Tax=Microbacterium invictum TaxID=515415 RepID=A0AA40VLV3_9MICO|nr:MULTISPECIES: glycosyltransferase [Microbacterium]MBB4139769.1 glycosyltransferase involved in cell wall biosynthesis [Microbacterium invictum]
MTRLLLFTNDYPYSTGDASFVTKEIDDLAARFDDVVVFCHARNTDVPTLPMPGNVRLGGNLFERSADDSPWAPVHPRMLLKLLAATWLELVSGRLRGHVRLFLMGARVGITQARRRAVREAIAESPDVVAYAFWGMGGGLGLAWLTGVRARAVRLHRYDLYEELSPEGYLPFRPFLFRCSDRVLAISHDGARYLAERYRSSALDAKTVISRLGVPGPSHLSRPPAGAEKLVVSCSAVTEIKRVDLVLAALRLLPGMSEEAPVRWVHFGAGPLLDSLRREAEQTIPGLRIELCGQTANDQIPAFYAAHRVDVFVNASASEGVPVSIMEAIAYGIPVVATDVGGNPEIVGPQLGTGELVPADPEPARIAALIRRIMDAGETAYDPRATWAREYDVRHTGPRAAELVRGLASTKGGA